uniref:uncharacterized protein LOC122588003 n=1 Tax=Erigeron canadensis TaxID=72917 RepID=UPI001CB8EF26|nr:uncharacterized protein LOC122588003 [Erigeron canadensis]
MPDLLFSHETVIGNAGLGLISETDTPTAGLGSKTTKQEDEVQGVPFRNLITDDNTLTMIYHLGEAQFEVKFETTFTDQLLSLTQSQCFYQGSNQPQNNEDDQYNEDDEDNYDDDEDNEDVHVQHDDEIDPMGVGSSDEAPYRSDDTMDGYSVNGDVSGDEEEERDHPQGPLEHEQYLDLGDDNDDQLMPFNEVQEDVALEHKRKQRTYCYGYEANIVESTVHDQGEEIKNYRGVMDRVPCMWVVVGSSKNRLGLFRITKWVESHNCYGEVISNNNRCMTASMVASEILPNVREELTYKVRQIQAQVKTSFNVDVSYAKVWNARRIAIERLYGTWPSNFDALPKYVAELQRANLNTIVEWLHSPTSSSNIHTFKFVFWAFRSAIRAFQRCILVIFVDGTHLKGSYKGKLLTVVTKNANGQLLPIAFGLVDEESNESWAWFLNLFEEHVGSQRQGDLCIISDRHQGILNAVNQIEGWHHRYCLRHVCSNVNSHLKNRKIKNLAWVIGSTSQSSKYTWAINQVKGEDDVVWPYLRNIGLDKWTLRHDSGFVVGVT